jgi:TolA-binding protein
VDGDSFGATQPDKMDARITVLERTVERMHGEIQRLRMIQEEVIQEQDDLRQARPPSTTGYVVMPNARGGLNAIVDIPVKPNTDTIPVKPNTDTIDTGKKQRLDPTLLVH